MTSRGFDLNQESITNTGNVIMQSLTFGGQFTMTPSAKKQLGSLDIPKRSKYLLFRTFRSMEKTTDRYLPEELNVKVSFRTPYLTPTKPQKKASLDIWVTRSDGQPVMFAPFYVSADSTLNQMKINLANISQDIWDLCKQTKQGHSGRANPMLRVINPPKKFHFAINKHPSHGKTVVSMGPIVTFYQY